MSDTEEMESDSDTLTLASQDTDTVISQPEASQAATNTQETSQGKATKQKKAKEPAKTKETAAKKDPFPCIYCPRNCASGAIQCAICALWCHMACTGLSKEALKGLEVQAKEVRKAYWACKSCMNFNTKWNNQMREVCKRQDDTEAKVADNSDRIEEVRRETEELRHELREQVRRTDGLQERMESVMDAELRERESRRLNLVIHGVEEPEDSIKEPRDRMEKDRDECEKIFTAMKARTRYQDIKFCRRIGERGRDPRPIVIGVFTEDEKRHLLDKARDLRTTRYDNVTVVPDLTKSQRRGELKLREEADQRNTQLTTEDLEKNLKWLVVGKRGEKRLIKAVEREGQLGRQERQDRYNTGWNPQINLTTRLPSARGHGGQSWRPEPRYNGQRPEAELGARRRDGFWRQQQDNRNVREPYMQARQQDRRPVVEDRYNSDQRRGREDRYQREDRDVTRPRDMESTRPLLQPRPPIRRSEETAGQTDQDRVEERQGRARLGSKRLRSYSREREEEEELPPRNRRF